MKKKQFRGVAVLVVLLMIFLVMMYTGASGMLIRQNYTNTAHRERTLKSEFATRAGISTALEQITLNPTWAPTQAAPYIETYDPGNGLGFKIWLEGMNTSSDTPLVTAEGTELKKGQAAIHVVPVVDGEEMPSTFVGAEERVILARPPVNFEHALFAALPYFDLSLSSSPARVLSYDSGDPVAGMPTSDFSSLGPKHDQVTVRSMTDVDCGATDIFGDLILPSSATLKAGSGTVTGTVQRLDQGYLLPRFLAPLGSQNTAVAPVPDGAGRLLPGVYTNLYVPPGGNLQLKRGGTYVFWNEIFLNPGSRLDLYGPVADGPVQIYAHDFWCWDDTVVNMPADPTTTPPRPEDLQYYGVNMENCTNNSFRVRARAQVAAVAAVGKGSVWLEDDSVFYGAAIGRRFMMQDNATVHYDLALRGKEFPAETQWVVVNQARD